MSASGGRARRSSTDARARQYVARAPQPKPQAKMRTSDLHAKGMGQRRAQTDKGRAPKLRSAPALIEDGPGTERVSPVQAERKRGNPPFKGRALRGHETRTDRRLTTGTGDDGRTSTRVNNRYSNHTAIQRAECVLGLGGLGPWKQKRRTRF
jgi:hypothetical protein